MCLPITHPSLKLLPFSFYLLHFTPTFLYSSLWIYQKVCQWAIISFLNVPGVSLMATRSRGVGKLKDPPLLLFLCWSLLLQEPPLCLQVALVTCVISLHNNLRCIPQCCINVTVYSCSLLSPAQSLRWEGGCLPVSWVFLCLVMGHLDTLE